MIYDFLGRERLEPLDPRRNFGRTLKIGLSIVEWRVAIGFAAYAYNTRPQPAPKLKWHRVPSPKPAFLDASRRRVV